MQRLSYMKYHIMYLFTQMNHSNDTGCIRKD